MKGLSRFIKPYGVKGFFACFLKLIEAGFQLQIISYMGILIDEGINSNNPEMVKLMTIKMLALSIFGFVLVLISHKVGMKVATDIENDIRNALVDKISVLTYADLDKFGTSTLTNRLTSDTARVRETIALTIRVFMRAPFLCIIAVIKSFMINPKMSIIFILFLPAFGFLLTYVTKKSTPMFVAAQKKLDKLSLVLHENLSGTRVIRALARQETEKNRVRKTTEELSDAHIEIAKIMTWINPLTLVMLNLGVFIVMLVGGKQVYFGGIKQGELLALTDYIVMVANGMVIVSNLMTFITKTEASAERINEVLDTEPSYTYPDTSLEPYDQYSNKHDAITFDNVSFEFEDGTKVLKNVSFSVPKGSTVGIIGTTGSGKSTVGSLMIRGYDTTEGEIKLDGRDIKTYSRHDIIDMCAIVPQKSVLFTGTVADNIRYARPDASDTKIINALKIAEGYDFVKGFRRGIDEPIRQGGQNLSGGQRQRLAIARAVVKDAPILILDDSLSALDYETDMKLRQNLHERMSGTTLVLISQRVSSVVNADQIIVLDQGEIVGIGKHDYLMETSKDYRELYESQSKSEDEEGEDERI